VRLHLSKHPVTPLGTTPGITNPHPPVSHATVVAASAAACRPPTWCLTRASHPSPSQVGRVVLGSAGRSWPERAAAAAAVLVSVGWLTPGSRAGPKRAGRRRPLCSVGRRPMARQALLNACRPADAPTDAFMLGCSMPMCVRSFVSLPCSGQHHEARGGGRLLCALLQEPRVK